jgi:hypothetical protein
LLANAEANAVNLRKWTPLHVAASRGHAGAVAELLTHGGDVAVRNDEGATPGDLARSLQVIAQPHFGRTLTKPDEVVALLWKAERLRANRACSLESICPAPVPGGIDIKSPGRQKDSPVDKKDDSTANEPENRTLNDTNHSNESNHSP